MKRRVNFGVITLFASVLISCATPMNPVTQTPPSISTPMPIPMDPATWTPPPPNSTPTPSPEGTYFTATPRPPRPIPTRTAYATPTALPPLDAIGTPGFDWEGPAIIYDGLKLSNYDGSQKKVIPIEVAISPWYSDYSPEAGRLVSTVDTALWTLDVRTGIQSMLPLNGFSNEYIESPVITRDGTKIAYSLVHGFGEEDIQQLWTINADGSENELAIDDTGPYITDPGPFRLIPFAWSLDNTRIYLVTTTDSEASPVGMYIADLIAGTIEKARTPRVTLWDVSFSPDRTRIAYRTFQWVPVKDSMPEIGPPFTLQVTDLTSGATRILQESDTLEYHYPVWSEARNQIAFTVRSHETGGDAGLFSIDLATAAVIRLVPGSEGRQLRPWLWLYDDRLVYTEEQVSSGVSLYATLYTIKNDGTDKHEIDSAGAITVIGVLDN